MELTNKQEQGLRIAIDRYHNNEKYTVISGYAGSGKTTLVSHIIEALDIDIEDVCYATYTGKAAEVLRKKGNSGAKTLHKLLYHNIPLPDGSFYRKPKDDLECDIVVVDEISMVPREMIDLLFSYPVYVICLGDPYQIPPIDQNSDNHLLDAPHVFLDEIMRQAKESEIIRLSMAIHEGRPIPFDDTGNEVRVLEREFLTDKGLLWADQVIVATNAARTMFNKRMRAALGRPENPTDGDKVICLRNYWDVVNKCGDSLVNGTIGYLRAPVQISLPYIATLPKLVGLRTNVDLDDGDSFTNLILDYNQLALGRASLDKKQQYKAAMAKRRNKALILPQEFDYGYAITCHKSQGSSWDKVVVVEENYPFDSVEHSRWLYTAITRASSKVMLFRQVKSMVWIIILAMSFLCATILGEIVDKEKE